MQQGPGQLGFSVRVQDMPALLYSHLNTVVRMDSNRMHITDPVSQQQHWCESLLSVRAAAPPDVAAAVDARIQQLQEQLTAQNAEGRVSGYWDWSHSRMRQQLQHSTTRGCLSRSQARHDGVLDHGS